VTPQQGAKPKLEVVWNINEIDINDSSWQRNKCFESEPYGLYVEIEIINIGLMSPDRIHPEERPVCADKIINHHRRE
jgi:hypothetical protein